MGKKIYIQPRIDIMHVSIEYDILQSSTITTQGTQGVPLVDDGTTVLGSKYYYNDN